jgi:TetR/AcrR family transcriptional repressor of nem operon
MARTSKVEKARTHTRLVESAARDFRAQGVAGASIPTLMEHVGLTHGTFYAHFDSKDALVAEVYTRGMAELAERVSRRAEEAPPGQGLHAVIERYLSAAHRDDPATGCFLPALAGEVRREPDEVRSAFTDGLKRYLSVLAPLLAAQPQPQPAQHDTDAVAADSATAAELPAHTNDELVLAAGMAGAVLLARAVNDPELSERILDSCREFYLAAFAPTSTSGVSDAT